MICPKSFNAVFRELITVAKEGTGSTELRRDIKKTYRAWDSASRKHMDAFHSAYSSAYGAVAEAGAAKFVHGLGDAVLLVGRSAPAVLDTLQDAEKVRAHACLAALFALSMAAHISADDPVVCSSAYAAVDEALGSGDAPGLSEVILDDDVVAFTRAAGGLFRIGGTCGLPMAKRQGIDGVMSLARSITDSADPKVFENLSEQLSSGNLDIGALVSEAAKLLGNVDLSKSGLDIASLLGGADIPGMLSGMGMDMSAMMAMVEKGGVTGSK